MPVFFIACSNDETTSGDDGVSPVIYGTGPGNAYTIDVNDDFTTDSLSTGNDEVWYYFTALSNTNYTVELYPLSNAEVDDSELPVNIYGEPVDPLLFVFSNAPSQYKEDEYPDFYISYTNSSNHIAHNNNKGYSNTNSPGIDESLFSAVSNISLPATTTVYILVTPVGKDIYCTGSYRIKVTTP
jgi:hypothetical protein